MKNQIKKFSFAEELAAQKPNALLLLSIFLAFGIGVYFALPFDPLWIFGAAAMVISLFSLGLRSFRPALIALFCVVLGFNAAQLRDFIVQTPVLHVAQKYVQVEGIVDEIEVLDKGVRLTLSDVMIDDVDPEKTPRRIRLKLWNGAGVEIGQRVRGNASLNPPSVPVVPGGFDFSRHLYFKGIGAVGFLYQPPEIIVNSFQKPAFGSVNGLRQIVGVRINEHLPQPESGLARALIIGEKNAIAGAVLDAIRDSGLAHMLALSGLHVGLVSAALFFALRFILVCVPGLALKYPVKKYAAAAAMAGAFFYMLLAGATIPTQRAMITVAVFFIAIMMDRSPISLRVVAFAAFFVLLFFPESLFSVSFQLSFAAVTALVAFYDATRDFWSRMAAQSNWLKKIGVYVLSVCVTTVIATLATAPLTLYHFQSLPVYGVLANLICVPILAFWVMPLAILVLLLMPLHLEGWILHLVDPGLKIITDLAQSIAAWPHAVVHIPTFSSSSLVFMVLAFLSVVILKKWVRLVGVAICVIAAGLTFQIFPYQILVSSKADAVMIRAGDGLLSSDVRKSRFEQDNWRGAMGLEDIKPRKFPKDGAIEGDGFVLKCDDQACRYEGQDKGQDYTLSLIKSYNPAVFAAECAWADIVVSQDIYDAPCDAYTINRRDTKYNGVYGVYFDNGDMITRTSKNPRYH